LRPVDFLPKAENKKEEALGEVFGKKAKKLLLLLIWKQEK
jgi:hypothetical protein